MENEKTDDESFEESSKKKLEEIIKQRKAENTALKKLIYGLKKLELKIDKPKKVKKKVKLNPKSILLLNPKSILLLIPKFILL